MRFSCDKTALLKEISFAQEIIATKNAISILSNVLLEAEDHTLTISATDIKVSFKTQIPVNIEEPGSTTVFCDKLLAILAAIPDGDIVFAEDDAKIVIKPAVDAKRIRFQLKSIASESFPETPAAEDSNYFELPVKDLREMISQTIFAISDDETRYFMNGVFMEKASGKLTMVATDGRRLAYISKELESRIPDFKGIIIPPKVLHIINKRAGDQGMIALAVGDKNLFVKFANYRLSSALIEAQFPNYQKVIPESQKFSLTVKKAELMDALKRVSLLVEQKSRRIFLGIAPGVLSISSEESEIGTAKEEIECGYEGEEATIALNYRYLEDPLKAIGSESITVHFTETKKAITLYPSPESDFFHIVMPMDLN
jgi:DNA polymerase III subunit beta